MFKDTLVIDGLQYCKAERSYFETLHKSGVTAVHVTLVYHENTRETLSNFAMWNRHFEQNADLIMPVHSMEDVETAKKENKVGIFFGAQNCSPIEDEIGLVEVIRRQGLLIMQLTYNNQSLLATGCYEATDNGISRFGKQVIKEMNRVGMIIDMSHSAENSTLEAIDLSERPICISHANPYVEKSALRNKSHTVLKALTDRGGLFGFSLYPFHLPNGSDCTLIQFCEMIARAAETYGVDCLAIGSDLCQNQPYEILEWMRNGRWSKTLDYGEGSQTNSGWPAPLSWFPDASGMENIYNELVRLGFATDDADKIIGKNWHSFLQEGLKPASL